MRPGQKTTRRRGAVRCVAGVWLAVGGWGTASAAWASVADTEIKIEPSDGFPGMLFGTYVDTDGVHAIVSRDSPLGLASIHDQVTGAEVHVLSPSESNGSLLDVAIEDDFAVAGGGTLDNRAWVFDVNTGDQLFELTGSDAPSNADFGYDVDVSGNLAIVGARTTRSAYVFDLETGDELIKLQMPDLGTVSEFGVAIDGDRAIVGVDPDFGAGVAQVFDVITGDVLQTFTSSDPTAEGTYGTSVAIDGDRALVGARFEKAFVYDLTTGDELLQLEPDDGGASFAWDVAMSGSFALVGAMDHAHGDAPSSAGAAYVFDLATGEPLAELNASDATLHASFGVAVGIAGNRAVVGAFGQDGAVGAAYLYTVPEPGAAAMLFLGWLVMGFVHGRRCGVR